MVEILKKSSNMVKIKSSNSLAKLSYTGKFALIRSQNNDIYEISKNFEIEKLHIVLQYVEHDAFAENMKMGSPCLGNFFPEKRETDDYMGEGGSTIDFHNGLNNSNFFC